jgi:hypothetical protein
MVGNSEAASSPRKVSGGNDMWVMEAAERLALRGT